ncbi:TIGR02234 family membrane protein [Nocardia sp. NBC_00508]|uniref:TIGR02234 family membrane protein n=1 Tax=Nocardia sp. NBC_00508 TaxID=2975992 RepID=UPI002E822E11|nr:TIGR02234 family membrane protein [Nocardia sp. NBC_00508]WUD67511.1 TIGR02234 family membrane protein [Nocardia sp. NBC_00508]
MTAADRDKEPGRAREPAPDASAAAEPESVRAQDDSAASAQSPPDADPRRGYPVGPVVLLAIAAAALWASSRMTWVTVGSSDGLSQPRIDRLNGGVWFGALTPLALVLLASIAAVLATRGWLRRVVGVLIALVAAVAAVPAFALLTNSGKIAERAAKLAELPGRAQVAEATTSAFPAVLALLGAIAAFGAGALLTRMPAETARLSGKYDNPAVRRAAATAEVTQRRAQSPDDRSSPQLSERVLWDALDAGTDPTEEPPDDPHPGEASRRGR